MARGKVQLRCIENHVHRQVTFCKRRAGLLKKARELSVLCEADIGIIIFNGPGKLFELATNGNMQELIQRYAHKYGEAHVDNGEPNGMPEEVLLLKKEIDFLQKGMRYMYGETSEGPMTLEELQNLERQLENWVYHIRSTKMQVMFQEIQLLENKAGILAAANEILQGKIIEQNLLFDGIGSLNYPLTIQNSLFNIASL